MSESVDARIEGGSKSRPLESTEIVNAQPEISSGFNDFDSVRTAMSTDSAVTMAKFGTPTIEDSQSGGLKKDGDGVIKPGNQDLYKTPHFDDYDPGDQHTYDDRFQGGKKLAEQVDKVKRAKSSELSVDKAEDGRVKGVSESVDDHGVRTSYAFNPDGTATRTQVLEESGHRDTVTFGADGKPVSREITPPGAKGPIRIEPNADDRLSLTRDADGIQTINSVEADRNKETTVVLDRDGSPLAKTGIHGNRVTTTEYGASGNPESVETEGYRDDGSLEYSMKTDASGYEGKLFDENGKMVRSVVESDGITVTNENLPDGTKVSMIENADDNSKRTIINSPNGVKTEMRYDGAHKSFVEITNPDGSKISSTEDQDSRVYFHQDKNKNWTLHRHNKATGVEEGYRGHGSQVYDEVVKNPI